MNSRERMLTAINRGIPDRLPVTNHFVMPYFLNKYMSGISENEFWKVTGLDPILWTISHRPDTTKGEYYDPSQTEIAFLESRRISTDNWRIEPVSLPDQAFTTTRYNFKTPDRTLSMVLQSNEITAWVAEPLVKEKKDIDLLAKYIDSP